MNTLKGIVDIINNDFVKKHSIIQTLIFDDLSEFDNHKDLNYPIIYLSPTSISKQVNNVGGTSWNFDFILADLYDSNRSYLEIVNECDLLAKEFFTFFNDNNPYEYFQIYCTNDFTIYKDTRDNIAGVIVSMKIESAWSYCEDNIRFKE